MSCARARNSSDSDGVIDRATASTSDWAAYAAARPSTCGLIDGLQARAVGLNART